MLEFSLKNYRPFRLELGQEGRHRFGGTVAHSGAIPAGADIPLHLLLTLDLSDPQCPVESSTDLQYLPLYYPLKFGFGGASVQYSVLSVSEIQIHSISGPPNDQIEQYIKVDALPESPAQLIPLEYEEARILGFLANNGYFQPSAEDATILQRLCGDTPFRTIGFDKLIRIGGMQMTVMKDHDLFCENPRCEFFGRRIRCNVAARVPPISVNGSNEFWYEYLGDMEFCFVLCWYCGSVIAFNRAS